VNGFIRKEILDRAHVARDSEVSFLKYGEERYLVGAYWATEVSSSVVGITKLDSVLQNRIGTSVLLVRERGQVAPGRS
jgi:hypothetical protein